MTLAPSTTTASALPRATSPTSIGTWPPSTTAWANWSGLMPERCARAHEVLGELLLVDVQLLLVDELVEDELGLDALLRRCSLSLGVELLLGLPLDLEVLRPGRGPAGRAGGPRLCLRRVDLVLDDASRARHLDAAPAAPPGPSPGPGCPARTFFICSSRLRLSARSSSRVSNSLASWAKSSSSSGSSRALTAVTLTVTSASLPARTPPSSSVVKVAARRRPPAPVTASSMPVEQLAGADRCSETPSATPSSQDLAVDLGLEVDRDEVAVGGGALDAREGGEALAQLLDCLSMSSSVTSTASTVDLDAGVVRELDLRADVDLGGEGQLLAVLRAR